jgi:hypothetical protein
MRLPLLLLSGATAFLVLGCAGGSDTKPPPPAPPDGLVVEAPPIEAPPIEAPPVATPVVDAPAGDARLLPVPWGDLGLGYSGTTVLLVEPAAVVLVTTSVAARDAETLFAAWQASLAAAGYTAGAATTVGDDTRQFWSLDARRVNIATGVVDTTAYVFAEDQQLLPSGAIVAGTTDDAVRLLLTAHAPATVVEAAPAEARSHGDTPGKNHAFSPTKGKGTSFTPAGDGKSGGKKPGGKGKGKKSE